MLPSSRINTNDQPDLIFQKKSEVFCSQFKVDNDLICIQNRNDWPSSSDYDCLHCAEKIVQVPYPAVKYHDPILDKYFVFGYFCRPCCSLGHVRDEIKDPRAILWTQIVLKKYFKINKFRFAPPRRCLSKYGGTMTLNQFYGDDANLTQFVELHAFPFVTFSMYAEVKTSDDVKGLRRPTSRTEPVQEQEQTEKTPLILEYIATKGGKPEVKRKKKGLSEKPATGNLMNFIVK